MVVTQLAKLAGIDYDPAPYRGKYSPRHPQPRDIPDDDLILECFEQITNPGWRWIYGIIATYGLRPHEVFHLNYEAIADGDVVIQVQRETKTGAREVWPFHPEWVSDFGLVRVQLPNVNLNKSNIRLGEACSHYFGDFGLPFKLYDMRHRWAIRTLEYGLDHGLAAQQMGHSREIHDRIYHRWISRAIHQRAYEQVITRSDRPMPRRRYEPPINKE
jgi:integrase